MQKMMRGKGQKGGKGFGMPKMPPHMMGKFGKRF
jgi:hypothetical protein